MKSKTKYLIFVAAILASLSINADVIDLKYEGYTGRYCPGNTLSYDLSGEYVERVMISAEGIGRDGFIKVYADGELIHNLGVPGYDPDYSFRVRRNVDNISLKFERTCSRVRDFKIFTASDNATNGPSWNVHDGSSWGMQLLDIVNSMSEILVFRGDYQDIFTRVLLPLKKLAISQGVADAVRDPRSLKTAYYSLGIAKKISDELDFFDSVLQCSDLEQLVFELRKMKEDILEHYDVRERKLSREIKDLKEVLSM